MYRKLVRTKLFKKDLTKVKWTDQHYEKFILFIAKLLAKESLPQEALDHQLKGEYSDFREFHIGGDLLVIYCVDVDIVTFVRIGSHSQMFN